MSTAPAPIKPPVQPSAPPLPPSAAPPPAIPPFPVRPLTVEQFEYLVDLGFYGDEKIELLDGWVVNKLTHGSQAATVITILSHLLIQRLPEDFHVRIQLPMTLLRSCPEPDVAVIRGQVEDFRQRHPTPAETPLVVEVSDSTLATDRGIKLRLYAEAGVKEYWIVNCVDRQVDVHTQPAIAHGVPTYVNVETFVMGETVSLWLPNQPGIDIPLATLFGES
jgi:Uma2 family endonuclease